MSNLFLLKLWWTEQESDLNCQFLNDFFFSTPLRDIIWCIKSQTRSFIYLSTIVSFFQIPLSRCALQSWKLACFITWIIHFETSFFYISVDVPLTFSPLQINQQINQLINNAMEKELLKLTHSFPMHFFATPWKHQIFFFGGGGRERVHWKWMG